MIFCLNVPGEEAKRKRAHRNRDTMSVTSPQNDDSIPMLKSPLSPPPVAPSPAAATSTVTATVTAAAAAVSTPTPLQLLAGAAPSLAVAQNASKTSLDRVYRYESKASVSEH